jgi:tetratricopeptide (TPR) repeat protein
MQAAHGLLAGLIKDHDAVQAEHHHRRAVEFSDRLLRLNPKMARYLSRGAAEVNNLALFLVKAGRIEEAEPLIDRAIAHQRDALKQEPRQPTYRLFLSNHLIVRANIARAKNRLAEETELVREQVAIRDRLAEDFPAIPDYRLRLARSLLRLAQCLEKSGSREESISSRQEHTAVLDALTTDFPKEEEFQREFGIAAYNLGVKLNELDRQAEAITQFSRVPATTPPYAESVRVRAWIRLTATDPKLRDPKEALRLANWGDSQWPDKADWKMHLAFAQHRSGDSNQAMATLNRVPKDPGGEIDLYFLRAMILHRLGDRDKAREVCASAIEVMKESKQDSSNAMLRVLRREALAELGLTEADFEKPRPLEFDPKPTGCNPWAS